MAKGRYQQLSLEFSEPESLPKEITIPGLLKPTVRTKMATTGNIKAGSLYVRGPAEAASLLAHIRKGAQEHLYVVPVDDHGQILEIHRYAKGTKSAASVNPFEVVGYVMNVPGARRVFIPHNHPSLDATASPEDLQVMSEIEYGLELADIKTSPLIIAGTKWKTLNRFSDAAGIPPANRKEKISVKERVFALNNPGPAASNEQLAREIKNELFGEDTEGFLLQDNKLHVVGFFEYPKGKPMAEGAIDLIRAIDRPNASSGVFFSNEPLESTRNDRGEFLEH